MKKNIFAILACAIAAVSMLTFTACSSTGKAGSSNNSSRPVTAGSEGSMVSTPASSADSSPVSAAEGDTLEDFFNSEEGKAELASLEEELNDDDDMQLKLSAQGNKMIYTFTITDDYDINNEEDIAELKTITESEADTFEELAAALEEAAGLQDVSVEIAYVNAEGETIYSQEFFAK